jgi:DNA-binding IclR family transcriptional regulator
MEPSAAPALSRGLSLLARLLEDGTSSLEQLAQRSGWPKSSVLRLLQSLEQAGCVTRDPASKRYSALVRLVPIDSTESALKAACASIMVELSERVLHTVELHSYERHALTMIERSEPEHAEVQVRARIGFRRDLTELDALTLVMLAYAIPEAEWPEAEYWHWDGHGKKIAVERARMRRYVARTREQSAAVDLAVNPNGVRRYAAPLRAGSGLLCGVLAVAESFAPGSTRADEAIVRELEQARRRVDQRLSLQTNQKE